MKTMISKVESIETKQSLIETASSYVGVSDGGTNSGKVVEMFQRAVDGKASKEPWCFRGDVEILTQKGWIPFSDLNDGHGKVAQVDEKGVITFTVPEKYIKKSYTGPGWHISSRSFDFVCDEKHRFWGFFNGSQVQKFGTLADVSHSLKIASAKTTNEDFNISDRDLILLSAYLSDGFNSETRQGSPRIRIQVSKDRKIECLRALSPVGDTTATKAYGPLTKIPLTTFTFEMPDSFTRILENYKELSWAFIQALSQRQAELFLRSYANFDGYQKPGSDSIRLFTSNLGRLDRLQALASLAGWHSSYTFIISKLSEKPCYELRFSPIKKERVIKPEHLSKIELSETLYCVQVPEGRILLRDKERTVFIAGNCMAFVQYCIGQTEIKMSATVKLYESEHCLTVWNRTDPAHKFQKPAVGRIAIWKHRGTTNGHCGIVTKIIDHVWMETIEGNTGPDNKLVERDGDGVYRKQRLIAGSAKMQIVGFIEPFGLPKTLSNVS